MAESWRPKWQNFRSREWEAVRDSWLAHVPNFTGTAVRPDPGLEHLEALLEMPLDKPNGKYPDLPGLRSNALWEAVFLFHKCAHTTLAAQRIAYQGMHSWGLFNAYHSAYLGAKGILTLLGVAFPKLRDRQVALDLFPPPETKKIGKTLGSPTFADFLIIPLPQLDQRRLWEAFQRVLNMTEADCWDMQLRKQILDLNYEKITPPRNGFLYKAHYWPLEDLALDLPKVQLRSLFAMELDSDDQSFLVSLSFMTYHLFEQLMTDLARYSSGIKAQMDASRLLRDPDTSELDCYRDFVSQVR